MHFNAQLYNVQSVQFHTKGCMHEKNPIREGEILSQNTSIHTSESKTTFYH